MGTILDDRKVYKLEDIINYIKMDWKKYIYLFGGCIFLFLTIIGFQFVRVAPKTSNIVLFISFVFGLIGCFYFFYLRTFKKTKEEKQVESQFTPVED